MDLRYLIEEVYNGSLEDMFMDIVCNSIPLPKFHTAVNNSDFRTVRAMIKAGEDLNHQEPRLGFTPIFGAIINGNARMLELLIRAGANLNVVTKDQRTPLTVALAVESAAAIRMLVENGADVHVKILEHQSALHMAVGFGNVEIAQLLIEHGVDVNVKNGLQETPLHMAVQGEKQQVVELLLAKGADVNAMALNPWQPEDEQFKMGDYVTPLLLAAMLGNLRIAEILVKAGANVNAKTSKKYTALHAAVKKGHFKLVNLLLEAGSNVDVQLDSGETPLIVSVKTNHYEIAQLLLKYNAAPDLKEQVRGATPLFLAVEKDQKALVKTLIGKGADVNAPNKYGVLPIHVAACSKSVGVAKMLLWNGSYYSAEVHAANYSGSPVEIARKNGNAKLVAALTSIGKLFNSAIKNDAPKMKCHVEAGAIINARNISGRTALHYAVSSDNVEAVNMLIANNADISYPSNKGNLPLHIAVSNGNQEIIEILLTHAGKLTPAEKNLIINAKTIESGNSALHIAAKKNNFPAVKLLIANGAVCNAKNKSNKLAAQLTSNKAIKSLLVSAELLFEGVKNEDNVTRVLQILEGTDPPVNARDADGGGTLLYWSISKGLPEIVNKLLSIGADYYSVTNKGTTPLHIAAMKGNVEITKALVATAKKDNAEKVYDFINAATTSGTVALHLASSLEVVTCLLQAGATYNIRNGKGKTAFELSQDEGIRKLLKTTNQMFEDVSKGVSTVVSSLNKLGNNELKAVANARNEQGHTLLQVAPGKIAGKLREKLKKISEVSS